MRLLLDSEGRLHLTWCYRETKATWASNHDQHYFEPVDR